MSLSDRERKSNIDLALTLLMQELGSPFDWQEHDSTEAKFSGVHRTTWDELLERGFVRATTFDRYILTPSGWIEGLKLSGTFQSAGLKEKTGRLSKALKDRVKGRHEPVLVDRNEISGEAGLDEYFVYDAIDGHLLRELFDKIHHGRVASEIAGAYFEAGEASCVRHAGIHLPPAIG